LVPSKLGPARRNYHVVEQLARFYDVSVIAIGTPGQAAEFVRCCRHPVADAVFVTRRRGRRSTVVLKTWRTLTGRCDFLPVLEPALRRSCRDMCSKVPFDAVVLSSVFLQPLPLPDGVPVVADTHNVEFDVLRRTAETGDSLSRRLYACWQGPWTQAEERRCARQVDLLLATSPRDQYLFEADLEIERVALVPNGIDVREFHPSAASFASPVIVFSGLMSYYPNQQGIRWFIDHVLPSVVRDVPGARLVVAGAAPPRWLLAKRSAQVHVTGAIPDIRPYLADAAVVIAPLMIGGGTRVKILEAQAMGKPVVSTSLGAEGLALRHDESILIGDDPESFARHVVRVVTDLATADRLGRAGRSHVLRHFNWDDIGAQLQRTLENHFGAMRQERRVS
jgi:glycosyltransferase involved in cell wall biosynthesis